MGALGGRREQCGMGAFGGSFRGEGGWDWPFQDGWDLSRGTRGAGRSREEHEVGGGSSHSMLRGKESEVCSLLALSFPCHH